MYKSPKDIYIWFSLGTRIIDNRSSVDIDIEIELGFGNWDFRVKDLGFGIVNICIDKSNL